MIDAWINDDTRRRKQERGDERKRRAAMLFPRIMLVGFVCAVIATALLVAIGNAHAETIVMAAPLQNHEGKTIEAVITAYTSSVDETDSTPFETASGAHTSAGVLACPPEYAFGTQVKIGEATYSCEDRMNERYWKVQHFDVWVHTKAEARQWGSTEQEITIYE